MSLLIDLLKDIEGKPSTNFPKAMNARTGIIRRQLGYQYVVKFFLAMIFCGAFLSCAYFVYLFFAPLSRSQYAGIHENTHISVIPKLTLNTANRSRPLPPVLVSDEIDEPLLDLGPVLKDQHLFVEKEKNYVQMYKQFNAPSDQEIRTETYKRAIEQATDGHWKQAIVLLRDLLRRYPTFDQARESLAAFYVRQGDVLLARKLLDDGIRNHSPSYVPFLRMQAHLLEKAGEDRDALALLRRAQPDIYSQPEYYALMAVLYEKLGQTERAGRLYQVLVRIQPDNGSYWLGLAVSLEAINRVNGAIMAYQHVLDSYQVKPVLQIYAQKRIQTLKG